MALKTFNLSRTKVDLSFSDNSAAFALPYFKALRGRLRDFFAIVFVMDRALAYAAGEHIVFISGLVRETGLALS